jgi:hypothetical protein
MYVLAIQPHPMASPAKYSPYVTKASAASLTTISTRWRFEKMGDQGSK